MLDQILEEEVVLEYVLIGRDGVVLKLRLEHRGEIPLVKIGQPERTGLRGRSVERNWRSFLKYL